MEAATDKAIAEQKLIAELFIHRLKMVDVSHHKDNPRYHNRDQIEQIAQSIRDHGYAKGSMVVQRRSMSLVAGNGVYDALILLGYEEADFIVMDMDDTESLQFMIRDNRLSELSEWDLPVLNADLAQLKDEGFELEDVGFELEAIEKWTDSWDVDGAEYPDLASGDRQPFQQMTFTLADEQAEQVKAALEKAKKLAPFVETLNENSNGNALARMAETYIGQS